MATIALLGAIPSARESKLQTLKWNALFQTFPTQLPLRSTKNPASLITSLKLCNKGSNFTVKCLANSKSSNLGEEEKKNMAFSFERVVEMVLKASRALQKPAITAVMLGLLLMYDPHSALAASGGRMGGRSFSSHSSSSKSSSSRSSSGGYSTRSSSFSSSGGYSAPYHASSPFGSTGRGRGDGVDFERAVDVVESVVHLIGKKKKKKKKAVGASFSVFLLMMVFAAFVLVLVSRFDSAVAVVILLACLTTAPMETVFLLMMVFATSVLVSGFLSDRYEDSVPTATQNTSILTATQNTSVIKPQVGLLGMPRSLQRDLDRIAEVADTSTLEGLSYVRTDGDGYVYEYEYEDSVLTATQNTSVIKLQVGLLGTARSLQRDLDRIAEVADTSTLEGLSYVLTVTTLALLRQPDYCISGYSSVDVKRSIEDGEKRFNQLSIEERMKFDEETLVNVNNIKWKVTKSRRPNGFSNEYIVITVLVAAEGVTKLPFINSSADLKEALQKLASIPSSKTMAVEVLWTPQNENDTLAERELLEDYPLLRPL